MTQHLRCVGGKFNGKVVALPDGQQYHTFVEAPPLWPARYPDLGAKVSLEPVRVVRYRVHQFHMRDDDGKPHPFQFLAPAEKTTFDVLKKLLLP